MELRLVPHTTYSRQVKVVPMSGVIVTRSVSLITTAENASRSQARKRGTRL